MDHIAHTDHGTVLRKDQYALIANMDGSFQLYMPDLPAGTPAPRSVMLLAAIVAKLPDEEWADEMIRSLEQAKQALSGDPH
jgi:hypothetical protein